MAMAMAMAMATVCRRARLMSSSWSSAATMPSPTVSPMSTPSARADRRWRPPCAEIAWSNLSGIAPVDISPGDRQDRAQGRRHAETCAAPVHRSQPGAGVATGSHSPDRRIASSPRPHEPPWCGRMTEATPSRRGASHQQAQSARGRSGADRPACPDPLREARTVAIHVTP